MHMQQFRMDLIYLQYFFQMRLYLQSALTVTYTVHIDIVNHYMKFFESCVISAFYMSVTTIFSIFYYVLSCHPTTLYSTTY